MNENLIPLTTERAREIGRMGGLVRTEKKRIASTLNAWKRGGKLSDDKLQYLYDFLTDPNKSILARAQILQRIEEIYIKKEKWGALQGLQRDWLMLHKAVYGDTSATQVNINVDNRTQTISLDRFTQAYEDHHGKAKRGLSIKSGKGKRRSSIK